MYASNAQQAPQEGLSRRERKKLEVRQGLIESAIRLFDRQGIARTTVDEICQLADVAQKTFFNYFPTRQHLIRAIAESSLKQLIAYLDEARRSPAAAPDKLKAFFSRVAEATEEAGPMHRELLPEMIHASHSDTGVAGPPEKESERARRLYTAFEELVREGISAGEFDKRHSVETLTEMVVGAFYSLMFNWANLDSYPIKERAERIAHFLVEASTPPNTKEQ